MDQTNHHFRMTAGWGLVVPIALLLIQAPHLQLHSQVGSSSLELTTTVIAQRAIPATVSFVTFDRAGDTLSQGSGFLVRANGGVITNWHVIRGAYSAVAILADGRNIAGVRYVASDTTADIALLSIPGQGYPTLPITDSLPQVGMRVVAVGSPLGLSKTVTEGIVSATRELDGITFVQISAPISHGSSGGPLLDDRGRVFAIATATVEHGQALNFGVLARYARPLLGGPQTSRPLALTTWPSGVSASEARDDRSAANSRFVSVYEGTVTNANWPDWPATLRIGFEGWEPSPHGYLLIGSPLGGSGPVTSGWTGDSVVMMTVSEAADTIFWIAEKRDPQLRGVYVVIGGQYKGQHGKWQVKLMSGSPLPEKRRPS